MLQHVIKKSHSIMGREFFFEKKISIAKHSKEKLSHMKSYIRKVAGVVTSQSEKKGKNSFIFMGESGMFELTSIFMCMQSHCLNSLNYFMRVMSSSTKAHSTYK